MSGSSEATSAELRATSDRLLDTIDRLRELEYVKRELRPDDPQFAKIAREVESLARVALGTSGQQVELGEAAAWAVEHGEATVVPAINEMPPPRDVSTILAEWRDAERRQQEARAGSAAAVRAREDAARLREEYRASVRGKEP